MNLEDDYKEDTMSDSKYHGLKPCPYCGSTNVSIVYHVFDDMFYIRCNNCHVRGPDKKFEYLAQIAWQKLSSSSQREE